jgi:PadR family transcriptional regulator PadR
MNIQCKSGLLELCVLSILSHGTYSGFDIQNELEDNVKINEGTIYPTMRRLVREGLIESYFEELDDGSRRKFYRITEQGQEREKCLKQQWNSLISGVSCILGGDSQCEKKNL